MSTNINFGHNITHMNKLASIPEWQTRAKADFDELNCIDIWWLTLDYYPDNVHAQLTPEQQQRLDKLLHNTVKKRYLSSRYWLNRLLREYLNHQELVFDTEPNGKPFLAAPANKLTFNLSHTEDIALLAVSNTGPVGIDIEILRPIDHALKLAKRSFDTHRYEQLAQFEQPELSSHFVYHWTQLEAQQKLSGHGIFGRKNPVGQNQLLTFQPDLNCIATTAWQNAKLCPQIRFFKPASTGKSTTL